MGIIRIIRRITLSSGSVTFLGGLRMTDNKAANRWFINVISFFLFSVLTITGLINWLLLPRGYGAEKGLLISMRHFLRQVHEWTALLFIVAVVVHLALHWSYVKANLKNYGMLK